MTAPTGGLPDGAAERLRVEITPFVWSTGDEDGVLAALAPVVADLIGAELEVAAGLTSCRRDQDTLRDRAAALRAGTYGQTAGDARG